MNLQTLFSLPSTAMTASGSSKNFPCGSIGSLHIDINVSAMSGSGASVNFNYSRVGNDGVLYTLWTNSIAAAGQVSISIGPGFEVAKDPGATGILTWTLSGTSPTATMSVTIHGK